MKARQAAEMDAVHNRLQEVLAAKDATITRLRSELEGTLLRLHQATEELMLE